MDRERWQLSGAARVRLCGVGARLEASVFGLVSLPVGRFEPAMHTCYNRSLYRFSGRCMRREWDWEVLVELEVSPLFMFLKKRLETAKNSAARSPVARVAGAEPPAD